MGKSFTSQTGANARAKAMEQIVSPPTEGSFHEDKANKQEAERPLFFC
jgi:hypothetical protein